MRFDFKFKSVFTVQLSLCSMCRVCGGKPPSSDDLANLKYTGYVIKVRKSLTSLRHCDHCVIELFCNTRVYGSRSVMSIGSGNHVYRRQQRVLFPAPRMPIIA
jgi:hypothetical protein